MNLRLSDFQFPEEDAVRCRICPHNCRLKTGQTGICRARTNHNGKIFSESYGNPCSIAIDPIEKKPLYHFHPGVKILSLATGGCNFRCLNCQNWEISQTKPDDLITRNLLPEELIQLTRSHGLSFLAFTYTEPTVFYEYMYDTAVLAKEAGIKTVLVSNGYINQEPLLKLTPYLDAANIDLKSFDDNTYKLLTGGKLQPVLESISTLKNEGVWLEITNLIIPEFTDNMETIRKMCQWLVSHGFADNPLHFSRFFPKFKLKDIPPTPEKTMFEAKGIAQSEGMNYVYLGNMH